MGRTKVMKTKEQVKAYNNAKSKRHHEKNADAINAARRLKYAGKKDTQLHTGNARAEAIMLTHEEARIRKSKANKAHYERNKDIIKAKRRSKGARHRKAPEAENGWSERSSYPIWQQHINYQQAQLKKALGAGTVNDFCRNITEVCLAQSSLAPLSNAEALFEKLQSEVHKLETSILNNLGAGVHTGQTTGIQCEIRIISGFLNDMHCEGLLGIEELRRAYAGKKLKFQEITL